MRVLVVDDSPDITTSMAILLRLYGYEVDTALDSFWSVLLKFIGIGFAKTDLVSKDSSKAAIPDNHTYRDEGRP